MSTEVTDHGHYVWANRKKSVFHRRVCLIEKGDAIPGCACVGDSRIFDFDGMFLLSGLRDYIRDNGLEPRSLAWNSWMVSPTPTVWREMPKIIANFLRSSIQVISSDSASKFRVTKKSCSLRWPQKCVPFPSPIIPRAWPTVHTLTRLQWLGFAPIFQ